MLLNKRPYLSIVENINRRYHITFQNVAEHSKSTATVDRNKKVPDNFSTFIHCRCENERFKPLAREDKLTEFSLSTVSF